MILNYSAIKTFLEEFEQASATKDFNLVEPFIHPDALFRFTEGDFQGIEEIRKAFERTWEHPIQDEVYRLSNVVVRHIINQSATVTFNYHWSGTSPRGPISVEGRGTHVIGLYNGRLQIILEHLSR